MAVLTDPERQKVMGQLVRSFAYAGLTKADVQAAVNAADDWCETNSAAYNAALPLPFRTTASSPQKAMILCFVAARRAGFLKVEGE